MDDTIDLLQIKIDQAKAQLPKNTLQAIDAVPWQARILKLREEKGYTFEQLGDLEIETELLLCGLLSSADYSKELQNRMRISEMQAQALVAYMNQEVFSKIREELIKNTEQKNLTEKSVPPLPDEEKKNAAILSSHGIEILPASPSTKKPELSIPKLNSPTPNLAPSGGINKTSIHPILAQKLSGPVRLETVKTEHTLENITKAKNSLTPPETNSQNLKTPAAYPAKADPYRLSPDE